MVTTIILPLLMAAHMQAPSLHEIQTAKAPLNIFSVAMERRSEFIANAPRKGPGPDHGGDTHDEHHDGGIPGNAHAGDGYPTDDPYNGQTDNNKGSNKPY